MPWLKNFLFETLCCIEPRQSTEPDSSATLRTLHHPPSTVSLNLPASTVPHGSINSKDRDEAALRQLFGSSSSVRGYQTATALPRTPAKKTRQHVVEQNVHSVTPVRKKIGRVEEIGNQVKKRFSETSLGRFKPQTSIYGQEGDIYDADIGKDIHLGTSHASTGLSELLAVRTVSQGGYDSDAKTIETPLLLSATNTIKASPSHAANPKKQPLWPMLFKQAESPQSSSPLPVVSSSLQTSISGLLDEVRLTDTSTKPVVCAPKLPVASRENSSEVVTPTESGTTDVRYGSLMQVQDPRNTGEENYELDIRSQQRDPPKYEYEQVDEEASNTLIPPVNDANRVSLMSNIDIDLIEYVPRYSASSITTSIPYLPDHGAKTHNPDSKLDYSKDNGTTSSDPTIEKTKNPSFSPLDIDQKTVEEPLHLDEMRISQRLASMSQLHLPSTSNSNHTSLKSTEHSTSREEYGLSRIFPTPRLPTFVSSEHNRKPSDPSTRNLFEHNRNDNKQRSLWTTVTSVGSSSSSANQGYSRRIPQGDASSFYPSDEELAPTRQASTSQTTRSVSARNPNSIAVGGRSASQPIGMHRGRPDRIHSTSFDEKLAFLMRPPTPETNTSDFEAEHPGQPSLLENRTLQISDERWAPIYGTGRRFESCRSTDPDEKLSEVSIEHNKNRRDEIMSEINPELILETLNGQTNETKLKKKKSNKFLDLADVDFSSERDWLPVVGRSDKDCDPPISHDTQPDEVLGQPPVDSVTPMKAYTRSNFYDGANALPTRDKAHYEITRQPRRSQSADGERPRTDVRVSHVLKTSVSLRPFHSISTLSRHCGYPESISKRPKDRKRSLADIRQRFATFTARDSASLKNQSIRDVFGSRAHHPNHKDAQCNVPASQATETPVREVDKDGRNKAYRLPQCNDRAKKELRLSNEKFHKSIRGPTAGEISILDRLHSPGVFFKHKNFKSYSLNSVDALDSGKRGRRGLQGLWKHLRSSNSGDLRTRRTQHAQTSSSSLESLPENLGLSGQETHTNNNADLNIRQFDRSQNTPYREDSSTLQITTDHSRTLHQARNGWADVYGECVGSFSALLSDAKMSSAEICGNPVRLCAQTEQINERTRRDLLKDLGPMKDCAATPRKAPTPTSDEQGSSSSESRDLRMPGSF